MHADEDSPVLPAYARRVVVPGGAWRRRWLYRMLRLTVRRQQVLGTDIESLRTYQAAIDARFGRLAEDVVRTPVAAGGVAAEWVDLPGSQADRILLYLHGGAFMFRFPRTHAALAASWCRRLSARALMVDYRLAPEHRYPAAPDDCHDAYRWLLESGADPRNIVIAGDSAGANLVLVTLQCIRDAGEPLPACAVAISPVTDFTLSSPSLSANAARDPMFTLAALVRLRGRYAPPETVIEPAVSPLFGNWSRLPPILFQAGDIEMLRDDALRAAARASAAGVAVEAESWADMAHVWHVMGLPQSEAGSAHVVEFIRRRTGWT